MTDIKWEEFRSAGKTTTDDQALTIVVNADDPMPIGAHNFELVVVDSSGNESKPARVQIIVRDTQAPTAVVKAYDLEGRLLPNNALEFGAGFILNAKGSLDVPPGKIEKYIWTLVD